MSLTAVTSLTLTTLPSAMPANTVAQIGSDRTVIDVSSATGTTALLHRWSAEFQRWVPSAAGAAALTTANVVTETRWDNAGVAGLYCMKTDAAATWQPMGGTR